MNDTWLVVGLGNTGPGYSRNRHNIGFMVAHELAARMAARFTTHKARALIASGRFAPGGAKVIVATPSVFMNLNGGPTATLAKFYNLPPERVIAIHDEIELPFDAVKVRFGGGEGGHNGLRDISRALGTKDYLRVRVGVGRPPGRTDPASHVLRDFSSSEAKELPFLISAAADAAELLISDGLDIAAARYSGQKA